MACKHAYHARPLQRATFGTPAPVLHPDPLILQDLITRLKACAKKRPAPKAATEPPAKRGALREMLEVSLKKRHDIKR